MPVKMAKSALVGLVGSVAIGTATRAASRRAHRTRVLGVVIPKRTDVKKLSRNVDYRDLLKRIGDAAEVIETHSDEIRMLSGQAKRLSRKLV
jgi:Cft2 family RNA processing exonuclease